MNCDDVFAILTRGPFPTGLRHDGAVLAHLQVCADCQRLAEALRPSSAMLQDSDSAGDVRRLPGYWGESLGDSAEAVVSLRHAARRRRIKATPPLLKPQSLRIWQFTAAVTLGIVLAAALRTLVTTQNAPLRMAANPRAMPLRGGAREVSASLIGLPAACRPDKPPEAVTPISFEEPLPLVEAAPQSTTQRDTCCTQCHHVGSEIRLSSANFDRLNHTCGVCHPH